jgi:hypothetical protein
MVGATNAGGGTRDMTVLRELMLLLHAKLFVGDQLDI